MFLLKRWLSFGLLVLVLVHCTQGNFSSYVSSSNLRTPRQLASQSPLRIVTLQQPSLSSLDKITIPEADRSTVCEFVSSQSNEMGGVNFLCGSRNLSKEEKLGKAPFLLGEGKLWVSSENNPSHLWINGVLHSCKLLGTDTIKCVARPLREIGRAHV